MEVTAMTALQAASVRAVVTQPADAATGEAGGGVSVEGSSAASTTAEGGTATGASDAGTSRADAAGAPPTAGPLSAVAAVREAVARLVAECADARQWPGPDRHAILKDLDHAVDALVTVRAGVLVAERDAGTWRGSGDKSPQAWRTRTAGVGPRAAAAEMRQAEHLDAAPAAAAAVTEGRIRAEHAAAIGAVVIGGTPSQREALLSAASQDELLALAETQDAGTFATTVAHRAATIDPAGLERDHQAQRRARFLHVSHTSRGTLIKGQLDPMAGQRFARALEALSPRPGADDDRDHGQRCADALDAMATRTLAADPRPGTHVPVQISLIVTEESWTAAQADRDRRRDAEAGAPASRSAGAGDSAVDSASVSYPPATLEDGTPVPASELAAAMCDCEITRIVLDADSVPLDVGRAQRVFTGAQRRAVIARDRECGWPDCHAPARWCDVHHIAWWERDTGPTSVENGVLLCNFHHHEVHRQDLTITRVTAAGRQRAPGRDRPPGTLTGVSYDFRDRAGTMIAPRPRPATSSAAPPSVLLPDHPADAPPTSPATRAPRPPAGPEWTGAPELEWEEDPVTGMRVPACWVSA
jgi:hypothetical protein